jgi:hypothetical protein
MQQQASPLSQWRLDKDSNPDNILSSRKRLSSFQSISSVTLNNTIYIYGNDDGRNPTASTKVGFISSKDVYNSKPPSIIKSTAPSLQRNTTSSSNVLPEEPTLVYSPGIPLDSTDEILVFASSRLADNAAIPTSANATNAFNQTTLSNSTTTQSSQSMKAFKFGLSSNQTWSLIHSESEQELVPVYRQGHSLSLSLPSKDNVYLFGGVNDSLAQNDFWIYSLKEFQWRKLVLPTTVVPRCGHTSTMLK